jgi:hypothetical protein
MSWSFVVHHHQQQPSCRQHGQHQGKGDRSVPFCLGCGALCCCRYYELAVGSGQEAVLGDRVAVHFDVRFRNITIATSRWGGQGRMVLGRIK